LLIMDEPTAALGSKEAINIINIIKKLKSIGITIIIISHRMQNILNISDKIIQMEHGEII